MKEEFVLKPLAPTRARSAVLIDVVAVAGAMTLAAWARIPLPFSPVPVTMQTLVALVAGFAVGPARATAGMSLYLACGIVGAPVFAAPSLGPTLGYLLAFVAVPWTVTRWRNTATAVTIGSLVIYAIGAAWLALWLRCSPLQALAVGVAPFLPGDTLKALVAAALAERLRRQ